MNRQTIERHHKNHTAPFTARRSMSDGFAMCLRPTNGRRGGKYHRTGMEWQGWQPRKKPRPQWRAVLQTGSQTFWLGRTPKFRAPPTNHNQPPNTMTPIPKPETIEDQTAKAVDPATTLLACLSCRSHSIPARHANCPYCSERLTADSSNREKDGWQDVKTRIDQAEQKLLDQGVLSIG